MAMGLVNVVVPHDQLDAEVTRWCIEIMEEAIEAIMKAEDCSRLAALERADPGLIDDYNAQGEMIAKSIAEAAAPRPVAKAITDFDKRVDEIMARDKIGKLAALEKVAREFPEAFAKYQEA